VSVKIFLSAVSTEFRAYRDLLRHDLTRHNVEVKIQEDFKDQGSVTLEKLDTYIKACDAVVHLVGDMSGAAAKPASTEAIRAKYPDLIDRLPPLREPLARGDDISYTQWEAWLALYHGKPLLTAKADATVPRDADNKPTDTSRAAQQAHLDRLRAMERYPGCTFATPQELALYIINTIILDLLSDERSEARLRKTPRFTYAGVVALLAILLVLLATPVIADEWAKSLGVQIAAPLALLLAVGCITVPLIYARYFGILTASSAPAESLEYQGYKTLRETLGTEGAVTRLYSRWLSAFLDSVDRLFGDSGGGIRTLFPHAFGLVTPAPLWTAPSLERCLWLALLYPISTVIVMWAISGHVGIAEDALGLPKQTSAWLRGLVVTFIGLSAFGTWRFTTSRKWSRIIWVAIASLCPLFIYGLTIVSVGLSYENVIDLRSISLSLAIAAIGVGAAVRGTAAVAGAIVGILATPLTFLLGILGVSLVLSGDNIEAFALTNVATFVVDLIVVLSVAGAVAWLARSQIARRWPFSFLLLYFLIMTLCCLLGAQNENYFGNTLQLLVVTGFLTLLNAPFDWISLGLTRALLRRGLELKSWWPFFLALVDALIAGVIVVLLALTMTIGVQFFNALTPSTRPGLTNVLSLEKLFSSISAHPELPEYWWIYVLVLSTMIPSLINLMIGGTALMRTAPGLSLWLLGYLPADTVVRSYDRVWIPAVLTAQVALGVILGVSIQALLAYGLIFHIMPAIGLSVLDVARTLAGLELPARVLWLLKSFL
jgi:Domain of unknown function (DUF4062)